MKDSVNTEKEAAVKPEAEALAETKEDTAGEAVGEAVGEAALEATPSVSPDEVNKLGAVSTTGPITDDGRGAAFFSSSDVRAMTRNQVRLNLDKILKSMESPDF